MKPLHLVLLILMNCLWAVSYAAFKALSPWLDSGGIATLRFGVAGLILILCWPFLPGENPRGRDWLRCLGLGIIVFVGAPRLQVAGVQMGSAVAASLLIALDSLVTSVAAAIFLRERIAPRRWIGFLLGVTGAVLMAEMWKPDFRLPALTGNILVVLSFFCEAAYSVLGKPMLGRVGLFKILGVALTIGTIVNLSIDGRATLHAIPAMTAYAWTILLYLSLICTLAGYSLWFEVIKDVDVNIAALTIFSQPLVGACVAVVWLGETLRWGQLWGSLAIIAGLVVGFYQRKSPDCTGEAAS